MKAIETTYKGVTFRSRLEARWAHAFDKHNIIWEYELEGLEFELDGATYKYLPDFYLPDSALYVEVKGSHNERLDKALAFGTLLAREHDEKQHASDLSSRDAAVTYQDDHAKQRAFQTSPQLLICDDKGGLSIVLLGLSSDGERQAELSTPGFIGVFDCDWCKKTTLRCDYTEPRCYACGKYVHYTIDGKNQLKSFGALPVMTEWLSKTGETSS